MRRLRLTLGYHGTHYAGWGVQSRSNRPTVQATVESALGSALGHPVRVAVAGRTDAGVHAEAQVASFDTSSTISETGLARVLTDTLPADVWVRDVAQTDAAFDARRSARRRWYRYAVWRHATPPAQWHGRALPYPKPLDIEPMRAASRTLLGTHDFAAFATRPPRAATVRTVFAADWLRVSDGLWLFEICADAFLKQMVRGIVGTSLLVGDGRWSPEDFAAAATSKDRRAAGPNAPALGLTLHRIDY